jgi:ketosteroid isomerase-like protein
MNINRWTHGVIMDLGLLLMLGICSCSGTSNETGTNAASEVEASEIAFAKTLEDRDLDMFLSFVSPEAVFFNGNVPIRGHEAITQAWAPFFVDEIAPFSWQPDVIEVLESGRLALSSGPIRGASGEILGRFNSIWRKDNDGQWRVIFDKGS